MKMENTKEDAQFQRIKAGVEDAIKCALAKEFNDMLKKGIIENDLVNPAFEMLFPEILVFVENKFSAKGLNALDKIIVRHTKYDWQKARKIELYLLRELDTEPNAEVIKEALEALRIDITKESLLIGEVIEWLQSKSAKNITKQDAIQAMEVALQGKREELGVLALIECCIAAKYFDWFCFSPRQLVFAVIDSYSIRGESLKDKSEAFLAKKRSESERASKV